MRSHLLHLLTPSDIGLPGGHDHVAVLSVTDSQRKGQTLHVDDAALRQEIEHLDDAITTLVFAHAPLERLTDTIQDMLGRFPGSEADALTAFTHVTEAMKQVHDDTVQTGLDRSTMVALTEPQVVSRAALAEALDHVEHGRSVDPAAIVANHGGRVALYLAETPGIA